MSTKTAKPPKPPPQPPPATAAPVQDHTAPPRSAWLHTLLAGLAALRKPQLYLTPPPANARLAEYFQVRRALAPDGQPWTTTALLGFPDRQADGKTTRTETVTVRTASVMADRIASSMASGTLTARRDNLRDTAANLLTEINGLVAEKLKGGERHPSIVYAGQTPTLLLPGGHFGFDATGFTAVRVGDVPAEHPLHTAVEPQFRPTWADSPTFVLGPADVGAWGPTAPRAHYRIETATLWTLRFSVAQRLKQRGDAATPQAVLELIAKGNDPREAIKLPPITMPDDKAVLATVQPPAAWPERVKLGLDAGRHPSHYLKYPTAEVTLADLVTARQGLGVLDHDREPDKYAAERLASACGGAARYGELTDLLTPLITSVDRRLQVALEKALEHACLAAEGEGDL